jgi:hypothetical protein
MTRRFAPIFSKFDLCLLRIASLLVPRRQRSEWEMEWQSELWHVRKTCTPGRSLSWRGEREVTAFCLGAFQDAFCLWRESGQKTVPLATTKGSAVQCLRFLIALIAISYGVALLLPGVRAALQPSRSRMAPSLVLIRNARYTQDSVPTISAEQFQVWKLRKQHLFDGFAFYRVERGSLSNPLHGQTTVGVAHASLNLFELLGLSFRLPFSGGDTLDKRPRVILSDAVWRAKFGGDPDITGRVVMVDLREAVVAGVATAGSWRLPGKVDVWLLEPDTDMVPDRAGFVVAHLTTSGARNLWSENGHMTARTPDGSMDDFLCGPLAERIQGPRDIFLFAVFLACLALPATTSLPLGEYRLSSRKLSWPTRLRRWSFLTGKIALLLPIVYLVSLDLAYLRSSLERSSSEYIQLVLSFSICLFGLRWALRDQRQRCPVCLGKLSHPAQVGQPSRTFLAWNGTELICVGGHGLLHVPEMPTSWFSTQRWLYLDPSWEVLFAESSLASTGYF